MLAFPVILLGLLGLVALYVLSFYNRLVTVKTRIRAAIQEIGNQLKRQADLIPNLIESVKGYLKHEKDIFDRLASARESILQAASGTDADAMFKAQDTLSKVMGQIRVVMESNPEIKGVEAVSKLMEDLRDTADKVMYSRRTMIDLTADYNVAIATFPNNLLAGLFKFAPEKGLTIPDEADVTSVKPEETVTPTVKL